MDGGAHGHESMPSI